MSVLIWIENVLLADSIPKIFFSESLILKKKQQKTKKHAKTIKKAKSYKPRWIP